MKRRWFFVLCSVLIVLVIGLSALHVRAQGGDQTLQPGVPQTVTLNAGQALTRTFSLSAGDTAQLTLTRQTEFSYTAVLIDPNRTAIALTPGADGNVNQNFDATAVSGSYTLVIQATNGSGDMVILLNSNVTPPIPLQMGLTQVTISDATVRYILTPPPDTGETTLLVQVILPVGLPTPAVYGLPATSLVQDPGGEAVFSLQSGLLPEISVVLLANQSYVLTFERGNTPVDLLITWQVRPSTAAATPAFTPAFSNLPTTGPCYLAFASGVNVRPGPSTAYNPPLGVVGAGQTLPVIARNEAGDWYQVTFNGQLGWVSVLIGAVGRAGDCSTLPVVAAPPLPGTGTPVTTGTTTITPTGTTAVTATMDPNQTWTPTATATETETATWTPTPTPTLTATSEPSPTQE